ncbi:MAG: dTDP-4-dehydrorhamnose 3,5-epimerase family protein [Thermodesulfobacteriota bacterium]
MFTDGQVDGVLIKKLEKYSDGRGWLIELFRSDETAEEIFPKMSYISMTEPGTARGPHEHIDQTDYFCFVGPSTFKLYLWDNREDSKTYKNRMVFTAGADEPTVVVVPPRVVHAYKNIGEESGFVVNCPNRLFMGEDKAEPVDEVRYENVADSPYIID